MKTETLIVELADRSYPIYFDRSLDALRSCLKEIRSAGRSVRILSDTQVLEAHVDYLSRAGIKAGEILSLPAGEKTKSVVNYAEALSFLAAQACKRDCAVFAFGGGVIGDLAGFVAASYLRGVDFYQIPTTLLSMVDSSVGGKTGINLPEGKNLVGSFWQPKAVFVDTTLLRTLEPQEFSAGMAEVIKYGLLADSELLHDLEDLGGLAPESPELSAIVRRCCSIKAEIISKDEKETAVSGGRALLNLGHTFAHAIENVGGYGEYLHGEAVAIGLVLATRLSVAKGQLPDSAVARVRAILEQHDLPTALRKPLPVEALMAAMQRDKKNRAGGLRFVTMTDLGRAITSNDIETQMVESLWSQQDTGE